jgi:hypothetical protein
MNMVSTAKCLASITVAASGICMAAFAASLSRLRYLLAATPTMPQAKPPTAVQRKPTAKPAVRPNFHQQSQAALRQRPIFEWCA